MVPLIDMANHSLMPSARLVSSGSTSPFPITLPFPHAHTHTHTITNACVCFVNRFEISDEDPTFDEEKIPGTMFLLRATRDLLEGEEVTICYDQVKYTFLSFFLPSIFYLFHLFFLGSFLPSYQLANLPPHLLSSSHLVCSACCSILS